MINNRELLFSVSRKDLAVNWFSGKGGGGQHRNKHQNCLRIRHMESGAFATGQSNKEREANKAEALHNLINHPKFKVWHALKVLEILSGKTLEARVTESMHEDNLKFEVMDSSGRWIDDK